jgi:transposase
MFMDKSHSLDIRERVEVGHSCRTAARCFATGDSTAIRLMQHRRQRGAISPPRRAVHLVTASFLRIVPF